MLKATISKIGNAVTRFPGGGRWIAAGRTLVALGQLTIIVLTPSNYLLVPVPTQPTRPICDGWRSVTAYCMGDASTRPWVTALLILILLMVVSGFFPAITGVIHYWATVSISTGISLPDGGEAVALVTTFYFALILLGDRRRNHWQPPVPWGQAGILQALSWAAQCGLRIQMAWIYTNAAVPKLAVEEWQDGTALYYVTRGEFFGTSPTMTPSFIG